MRKIVLLAGVAMLVFTGAAVAQQDAATDITNAQIQAVLNSGQKSVDHTLRVLDFGLLLVCAGSRDVAIWQMLPAVRRYWPQCRSTRNHHCGAADIKRTSLTARVSHHFAFFLQRLCSRLECPSHFQQRLLKFHVSHFCQ